MIEFKYSFIADNNSKYLIILEDETLEDFIHNFETNHQVEKVFIGINVLLSSEYKRKMLERGIDLFVVPDYYYSDL